MLSKKINLAQRSGKFEVQEDSNYPKPEFPEDIQPHKAPKKKFNFVNWSVSLVLIILVASLTYLVFSIGNIKTIGKDAIANVAGEVVTKSADIVNPSKSEKRYYTVLVMGIDTRGVSFNGEEFVPDRWNGTRKIDVIMQIVYDRQNKRVNFISIPRDTSITAEEECMHQEREDQKYINRFYDMAEKNDCPFTGADAMKKYVTKITGFENDHHVITTLDTFVELINIVGVENNGEKGVWIDSPRNISDYCPNDQYGYNYVYFPEGRQFLNAKEALCYVRVRKTSSDFDRNRRQQQLITEIAHLITSSSTLTNPVKLLEIYRHFNSEMEMSKISLQDVTLGLEIMDEADLNNINKIVLDDHFGGVNSYLTKPLYSKPGTHTRSGYYLIPTVWDKDCCQDDEWKYVREYVQELVQNPDAEPKQASIYVYANQYVGGAPALNNPDYNNLKLQSESKALFFHESKYALKMHTNGADIQIYDFTDGGKTWIVNKLKEFGGTKVQVYPGSEAPFKRLNNEEIAIVVRN